MSEPEDTGFSSIRSWRTIYTAVIVIFFLWVGLLTWFMRTFS